MASKFAEIYVLLGLKKEGFDKGVKSTKSSMADLGKAFLTSTAAIAGVGVAMYQAGKQIYEVGKRGAIVTQTADSFELLSQKLGLAPTLLEDLRKAARGTVDDMTLMSSVATLLAGTSDELGKKLGDATPRLLEIAKAANKLNPSLGDTAFMFSSISTGIKRAQPLILDNLGLTIKIGQANSDFADKLGKSVEALTAEEKAMAILNATLEAGDTMIAQVGGNVDAATDSYAQMETQIANLTDELKVMASTGITPVVTELAEATKMANLNFESWGRIDQALNDNIITQQEYNEWIVQYLFHGASQVELLERIESRTGLVSGAVIELDGHERAYIDTVIELTGHERAAELQLLAEKAALEGVTTATDNTKAATDLLNLSMKAYSTTLLFNLAAANMDTEAAASLALALGLVDERTAAAIKGVGILTTKYDLNGNEVIELTEATGGFNDAVVGLGGSLDTLSSQTSNAAGQAARLGREIRALSSKTITITTKFVTTGGAAKAASSGLDRGATGQHGLNMIVPPGFPGDSFPIAASSGERVIIQRKDQIGSNMMAGISGGVRGGYKDTAKDTMNAMGGLVASAEKALGISSPSEMFYDIGLAMMTGLAMGIQRGQRGVDDALADVMNGLEMTAASGMNDVIGEVDRGMTGVIGEVERGATGVIDEAERGMRGAQDATEEGFGGMIGEAERGMRGFNDAVYQGITYTQKMMDESYANMLKYWEDAG